MNINNMFYKTAITVLLVFCIRVFADYDTIDYSGNKAQFQLVNNSNTAVSVDSVTLFKWLYPDFPNRFSFDFIEQNPPFKRS
jgi:hypothetical protein